MNRLLPIFVTMFTLLVPSMTWADDGATLSRFTWAYVTATQTLTITAGNGDGNMGNAEMNSIRPWESYKNSIQHLVIGSGITYIGNYVFYNHKALQDVTFEEGSKLEAIGHDAFNNCTSLSSITLPEGLTTVHNYAFSSTGLTSVTLPSTVTTIYGHSFDACNSLASVVMYVTDPTTLTLESTSFQSGVTVYVDGIDAWNERFTYANYHCNFVEMVTTWTSGDTDVIFYAGGQYPSGTMTISKKAGGGKGEMADYIDPSLQPWYDTLVPPWYAILNNIKTVIIEDGVTKIGNSAFDDCSGLTSISIPNSVTSIGDYVFNGCSNLTSLTIPNSLTTIGSNAFFNSGLTSVDIPCSVTTIGSDAFYLCENLSSVYCYASSVELGDNAFRLNKSDRKIYVLSDRVNYYKAKWSSYAADIEEIPDPAALTTTSAEGANWSTYYNSNANVQVDANTTVYKVTLDGSSITLTNTGSKIIKAGEAVVLCSTTSGITLAYTSTASTGDYTDNSLLGSNTAVTQESGYTYYALANLTNGLGFYKVGSSVTIPANKAYIRVASGESRDFYGIDEDTTSVELKNGKIEVLKYYDLNGRRVEHPTKGLYIVNDKKVVFNR